MDLKIYMVPETSELFYMELLTEEEETIIITEQIREIIKTPYQWMV